MKFFFTDHKILAGTILLLFIFSLLCQIITGFLYQNMIKETYNMSSTENKTLKACKLKFTNRYELYEKVANVPVFVDKFLYGVKIGFLPIKALKHLSGQFLLLAIFAAGAGACRGIIAEETIGEILSYYISAFIMLYAYFAVSAAVDIKGKKEALKTNLIDYLENNISIRIPQSKKEQERLDKLEAQAGQKVREEKRAVIADFASHKKKEGAKKLEPEEMKELRGLLREFV